MARVPLAGTSWIPGLTPSVRPERARDRAGRPDHRRERPARRSPPEAQNGPCTTAANASSSPNTWGRRDRVQLGVSRSS